MTNDDAEGLGCLLALLLVVPAIMWSAWVLVKLWGWFLVPLGLPVIGLWHAAGLRVLIGFVARANVDDGTEPLGMILRWALAPTLALVFGWAFQHMMA